MTTDVQTLSFAPALVDHVDVVQGNTWAFVVTLLDDAGAGINLTGTTADMEIKRLDGTLVLALSIGNGITYTDPTAGEMTITVAAADTVNLDPEFTYLYDVRWANGATIRTVASGELRMFKRITD